MLGTALVRKHFPARAIPKTKKERARLHKEVDAVLLADPAFAALYQQFRTKIALGMESLEGGHSPEAAVQHALV